MKAVVVRALADRQEIELVQPGAWHGAHININAAMVPKLVADLMCAAVALGAEMDWPQKPIQMQ